MTFLYLMGGSGCGKSTLAKKLESFDDSIYHNVLETTTRQPRENEVEEIDYHFTTPEEFERNKKEFFQVVEHQFAPSKYGAGREVLNPNRINVVVICLEGFISAMKRNPWDSHILVNIINDVDLDVQRSGRDPKQEENINLAILNQFKISDDLIRIFNSTCLYYEIKLSELKKIRNDKEQLLKYFNDVIIESYQ